MPKILIANVDNECMLGDRSVLTYEFCCHSAIAASKHVWFAEPGDIVVLPEVLSQEMHDYVAKVKGISRRSITFVTPEGRSGQVGPLQSDELLDCGFVDRLRQAMVEQVQWELRPYYFDGTAAKLAKKLGLAAEDRTFSFLEQGGADLFNSKQAFRSLAIGRGVPVARGEAVSSMPGLVSAIEDLIQDTGAVIIKQNRHSGGDGNLIVAATRDVDGQGAIGIVHVNRRWPIDKAAASVWQRLATVPGECLIVEVYHPVTAVCYAEYSVPCTSDAPIFLNLGEQRMAPTFEGFEIPGRIPPYQQARFVSGAGALVRMAQELGFTGLIDVDGIITADGEVAFCEMNGRHGGCSHVHYLAEKLLKTGYGNTHTVLTRNGARAPYFEDVVQLIDDHDLSLSCGRSEGIVITAEDTRRTGKIDYLVGAARRRRAHEIEQWFLERLTYMQKSARNRAVVLGAPRQHAEIGPESCCQPDHDSLRRGRPACSATGPIRTAAYRRYCGLFCSFS